MRGKCPLISFYPASDPPSHKWIKASLTLNKKEIQKFSAESLLFYSNALGMRIDFVSFFIASV